MFYREKERIIITLLPNNVDFYGERDIPKILTLKKQGGIFDEVDSQIKEFYLINTPKRSASISGEVCFLDGYYDNKFIPQNKYCLRDACEFAVELVKMGIIKKYIAIIIYLKEIMLYSSTTPAILEVKRWHHNELLIEVLGVMPNSCWAPGVGVLRYK